MYLFGNGPEADKCDEGDDEGGEDELEELMGNH